MHMRYTKSDTHTQAKNVHAQDKMRCASEDQNEMRRRSTTKEMCMRMRRPIRDAHAQIKMRCACAGQNDVRMHRSK